MDFGGNKNEKNKKSLGIFSKMRDFFDRKDEKFDDGEKYGQEKETLKKYDDVLKNEVDKKNYQNLKKGEVNVPVKTLGKEKIDSGKVDQKSENETTVSKNSWNPPTILRTNLAKGELVSYIDWSLNIKKLILVSVFSCFLLAAVYSGLIVLGNKAKNEVEVLDNEINSIKLQVISSISDVEEIDNFYKKLKKADILLNKHIYWNNIFKFVEKNTLKKVQIVSGLSGEVRSEYSFSVVTDNFTTLNQQVEHFKKQEEVIDVEIVGGNFRLGKDTGTDQPTISLGSNIKITLKPEIFFR